MNCRDKEKDQKTLMILPVCTVIRAKSGPDGFFIQEIQRNNCQAGECLRINIRNENDMPQRQGGFGYG